MSGGGSSGRFCFCVDSLLLLLSDSTSNCYCSFMQIGNRFRYYPSPLQQKTLLQWIGCQRHIYNAKTKEDRYFRRFARSSLSHTGEYGPIDQTYAQYKSDLTPFLSDVPSALLRNGTVLWKQAYQRFFKKLAARPTIKQRHGKQSVWLTSELFLLEKNGKFKKNRQGDPIAQYDLRIGTKKFPVGSAPFTAHKVFKIPVSIHVSVHFGRWYVSFNYDDDTVLPSDVDTAAWLREFDEQALRAMTVGLDRGVELPLAGSDGQRFEFSTIQKARIKKQERHKKRWQRRQARRVKGSSSCKQARSEVAKYQRYAADVRRDMAHKTSHCLATDPRYKLYVFEALKVVNMSASVKAKQDANGKWIPNGRAAKAGLNKAILGSAWGQAKIYLTYKARRQGKLAIEVPAFYTSQECAACGHIHKDNRVSQSEFVCQACHHQDNADRNAAKVIAVRGVQLVIKDLVITKTPEKTGILKKKQVGMEDPEPAAAMPPTPEEIKISQPHSNVPLHWSLIRETPATTPQSAV